MPTAMTVRPTREEDWERVRDLRLEMLADTPKAYVETLETARGHDEAEWRVRARRGSGAGGTALVAELPDGRWVGAMGAFVSEGQEPLLVGVYVHPDHRGREAGVTDALLTAVEDWVAARADRLVLHVHEENARARAAYAHRGYRDTGERLPYPLAAGEQEVVMAKELRRG